MSKKVSFKTALKAIGQRKKVTCVVEEGSPVVYQVKIIGNEEERYFGEEHLTVDGKVYDIRNFCFSPTQILYGEWTIEN